MRLKILFVVLLCFIFSIVLATSAFAQSGDESVFDRSFDILVSIFSLEFLQGDENRLYGFLRATVWIGVFTIMHALFGRVGTGMFTGSKSIILAGVIATMSVIAIPNKLLHFIAGSYSSFVSAVLIGILIIGMWHVWMFLPRLGLQDRTLEIARWVLLLFLLIFIGWAANFAFFPLFIPLVPWLGRHSRNLRGGL